MKDEIQINRLMTAVVQSQDIDNAINALNGVGIKVTIISSYGEFLGRKNATLLIGLCDNQEELVVNTLASNCRQRVEYVATRLEGAPYQIPLSTPISVGGATIFTVRVAHWEEL
jgi:uncharacterized protein YaaQ